MKLPEAKAECERWFAYLERQKERSVELQRLASERRAGTCDDAEMRRRMARIDGGVTVYDGANLAEAVRVLLKHVSE